MRWQWYQDFLRSIQKVEGEQEWRAGGEEVG